MKLPITLAALALFTASAPAAIIITAPTSTTNGSIKITTDLTFTMQSPATFGTIYMVLDELAPTNDGAATLSSFVTMPTVIVAPVPGTPSVLSMVRFSDNAGFTSSADVTEKDGIINFGNLGFTALGVGDTFTIKAGTFELSATDEFNPLVSGTFNGPLFLVQNLSGLRVSDIITVPEPSAVLLSAGALGFGLLRRRRK